MKQQNQKQTSTIDEINSWREQVHEVAEDYRNAVTEEYMQYVRELHMEIDDVLVEYSSLIKKIDDEEDKALDFINYFDEEGGNFQDIDDDELDDLFAEFRSLRDLNLC